MSAATAAQPRYRVEKTSHGFSIFFTRRRMVRQTVVTSEGKTVSFERPYSEVFQAFEPSLFDAYYRGKGEWSVDVDCGAQRWDGTQTTKQVRDALRRCNFSKPEIDEILDPILNGT